MLHVSRVARNRGTRHTSHVTRHTSLVTRHTQGIHLDPSVRAVVIGLDPRLTYRFARENTIHLSPASESPHCTPQSAANSPLQPRIWRAKTLSSSRATPIPLFPPFPDSNYRGLAGMFGGVLVWVVLGRHCGCVSVCWRFCSYRRSVAHVIV